jgi:hypothetical protein
MITLSQARELLPTRPDISTLFRWCVTGIRGVRLEYWRVGSRLLTTAEALEAFNRRLRELDDQPRKRVPRESRSAARRGRDVAGAKRRLAAAGF